MEGDGYMQSLAAIKWGFLIKKKKKAKTPVMLAV